MTILITLTTAGSSTGPFSIYSNVDSYSTPFETGVSRSNLLAGYVSTLLPSGTTTVRVMSTGTCTNYTDISVVPCPTTTTTTTVPPTTTTTTTVPPTTTTTTTPTPGCQQIFLYPNNATACAHLGSFIQFDTDNALAPTRLWVLNECGVTPVTGGNQWYSQGPGSNSYQVDNGGFIIATTACP
jgi:hypothetical protein